MTLVSALCATACLDTTDPNARATDGPPMSATIDGSNWYATGVIVKTSPGFLSFGGVNSSTNTALELTISATAPGTYRFGPNGGGAATVGLTSGQVWSSTSGEGSGTLVITKYETRHVAGTFEFAAVPTNGGATGTVHITNGKFDVSY